MKNAVYWDVAPQDLHGVTSQKMTFFRLNWTHICTKSSKNKTIPVTSVNNNGSTINNSYKSRTCTEKETHIKNIIQAL
jgi:hypothetical protein